MVFSFPVKQPVTFPMPMGLTGTAGCGKVASQFTVEESDPVSQYRPAQPAGLEAIGLPLAVIVGFTLFTVGIFKRAALKDQEQAKRRGIIAFFREKPDKIMCDVRLALERGTDLKTSEINEAVDTVMAFGCPPQFHHSSLARNLRTWAVDVLGLEALPNSSRSWSPHAVLGDSGQRLRITKKVKGQIVAYADRIRSWMYDPDQNFRFMVGYPTSASPEKVENRLSFITKRTAERLELSEEALAPVVSELLSHGRPPHWKQRARLFERRLDYDDRLVDDEPFRSRLNDHAADQLIERAGMHERLREIAGSALKSDALKKVAAVRDDEIPFSREELNRMIYRIYLKRIAVELMRQFAVPVPLWSMVEPFEVPYGYEFQEKFSRFAHFFDEDWDAIRRMRERLHDPFSMPWED